MKIERITLCNLTAFEGEHTIDFTSEPLRSAGLFAVTGDTGAGKSTLLDAIALALYDNAPRLDEVERVSSSDLGSKGDNEKNALQAYDTRNVIRRGQKTAYARVEFSLTDGSRYEAEWQCRVKRTGRLDAVTRRLRQLEPQKKLLAEGSTKAVQPLINSLTGLDYTQFSRTVMLAQGSFATFLQARRSDKSALLEKLTGTEIYGEISVKIHELTAAADLRLRELESKQEGIRQQCLPPEELEDIQTEIHQHETLASGLRESIATTQGRMAWTEQYLAALQAAQQMEAAHISAHRDLRGLDAECRRLAQYDRAQAVQPLYQQMHLRTSDLEALRQQEQQTQAERKEQEGRCAAEEQEVKRLRELVETAEKELASRQPEIRRGLTVEGEIAMIEEQLEANKSQTAAAERALLDRRSRLQDKRRQLDEAEKRLQQLQLHHQQLVSHRAIFDKNDLIRDKLASLLAETEQERDCKQKLSAQQKRQEELRELVDKAEALHLKDEEKRGVLRADLQLHRTANAGHDGEKAAREVQAAQGRLSLLSEAASLWRRIAAGYEAERRLDEQARFDAATLRQKRKEEARALVELAALQGRYETLREAYTLSNSTNIAALRKNLKEGSACPVCGATHHPYHTETERELGELMDKLERDHAEARDLFTAKQGEISELRALIATTEGRLKAEEDALEETKKSLRQGEEEWMRFAKLDASLEGCSASVDAPSRLSLIDLLADSTRKKLEEAREELVTYNSHQTKINDIAAQIETLSAKMAADGTYLESLRTNLRVGQATIESLNARQLRASGARKQLYGDLDEMITLSAWYDEWTANPEDFRRRLLTMAEDWRATNGSIEELSRTLSALREEVRAAEDSLAEAERAASALTQRSSVLAEMVLSKRDDLRRVFGRLSPRQEEERLEKALQERRLSSEEAEKKLAKCAESLTQLRATLAHIDQRRTEAAADIARLDARLHAWLLANADKDDAAGAPLSMDTLRQLFDGTTDWKALRERVDGAKERVSLAAHELERLRAELLRLAASTPYPEPLPRTAEEVQALRELTAQELEQLSAEQERTGAALLARRLRLATHEQAVSEAEKDAATLAEAREDLTEWRRLDALLGSADGKRFRTLAQSLTFRILVREANACLRTLSPRYELHNIPGTLLLEVTDRYMFDQRRYVSSLSGGETFVVSLALALALANISGGKLAIRSLFIDEGFGNLDQQSLDLVMETLSRLDTQQGRKVGIISHTRQIRQQISPQIVITKQPATGRSRIEIR